MIQRIEAFRATNLVLNFPHEIKVERRDGARSKIVSEGDLVKKLIEKETAHSDEIHRHLFDKIDEIKNILLQKK